MSAPDTTKIVEWLTDQYNAIMGCEKKALELMEAGDIEGYRENMRAKATALANLATNAQPLLADLPHALQNTIKSQLEQFSRSAQTALQLNSVFYMSALLYPDDHTKGEPDNFAIFIDFIR